MAAQRKGDGYSLVILETAIASPFMSPGRAFTRGRKDRDLVRVEVLRTGAAAAEPLSRDIGQRLEVEKVAGCTTLPVKQASDHPDRPA